MNILESILESGTTYEQFCLLMRGISACYRDRFRLNEFETRTWYALLYDIPHTRLKEACTEWVRTRKFAPTPAELRELAEEPEEAESAPARTLTMVAWSVVVDARLYALDIGTETEIHRQYANLPNDIKQAVGSAERLIPITKAEFYEAYKAVLEAERTENGKLL